MNETEDRQRCPLCALNTLHFVCGLVTDREKLRESTDTSGEEEEDESPMQKTGMFSVRGEMLIVTLDCREEGESVTEVVMRVHSAGERWVEGVSWMCVEEDAREDVDEQMLYA